MNFGEQTKDAYNKIAKTYYDELWNDHPYDKFIDNFIKTLSGSKVLDIGCAIGSFSKYVADKDFDVDAIDFSEEMVKIAKEKVNNVKFYVMDMLDMKFNKSYDGIMAINSTIHIEKKKMKKLFESIYDLLNEKGIFFIILQEGDGEKLVLEPFDETVSEFVSFYRQEEIEKLFNDCNFNIVFQDKIVRDKESELGYNQLVYCLQKKR